jgi:hypothetical protein
MARGRQRQLDLETEYWSQQIKRVDIGNDAMPAGAADAAASTLSDRLIAPLIRAL